MSITTVICPPGIQYSFHIQVKPLFLSAPPTNEGERGRGEPVEVLVLLETEGETGRDREGERGEPGGAASQGGRERF